MLAFILGFAAGAILTHFSQAQYQAAGQWVATKIAAWRASRAAKAQPK